MFSNSTAAAKRDNQELAQWQHGRNLRTEAMVLGFARNRSFIGLH